MNCNTGHLVRSMDVISSDNSHAYIAVPANLQQAADKKLRGRAEATVSLSSGGKLSKWAASERKQRRLAKQARKRNR